MRIPDTLLERLNSQADLVSIIRRHTDLKPAGREFKGCCPFHGEKTPSFYVNPQTNLYHCFGCGASGNPVTFLREYERLTFMEAVKVLADQTHIELPKDDADDQKVRYKKSTPAPVPPPPPIAPPSDIMPDMVYHDEINHVPPPDHHDNPPPQAITKTDEDGNLYQLLSQIAQYYQFMLKNTPTAKKYFLDRGLTEETISEFGLGYAPTGWQHLEQAFPQDLDGLKILGLVRTSNKSGRQFDLLRDRVIFPIKDRQGRIVGFAGRAMGDETPKYINSSESPIFAKQHILYGLYEARQKKASRFLMVEGYMDVIALHQAGIYGAVAPMGTAANESQINHLLKYDDCLTLCFDGDSAGQKAAWRTLEVAVPVLPDGKELKFLTLPDNHDPDSFLKAYDTQAMEQAITNAQSLSDYVYWVLSSRYDLSAPENKAKAMADLKGLTVKFPKGSSFKYWLNNDIYARLGNKKKVFKKADTADYRSTLDIITQACLCLLYAPSLCKTGDPLAQLLSVSGVDQAHVKYTLMLERLAMNVPDLPTWHSLDTRLEILVQTITQLLTIGEKFGFNVDDDSKDGIDKKAQFILASLNPEFRESLSKHWRDFAHHITEIDMDISWLFNELLCQILQDVFKKQQEQSRHLLLSEIYKRREQALAAWRADNQSQYDKLIL